VYYHIIKLNNGDLIMVSFTTGKVGDPGFVDPNSPEAKSMVVPSIDDDFVDTADDAEVSKVNTGISVSSQYYEGRNSS
jgi:hypothetical protein